MISNFPPLSYLTFNLFPGGLMVSDNGVKWTMLFLHKINEDGTYITTKHLEFNIRIAITLLDVV